jgi:DNA-binding NarL/FixJ family response regulator
LAEPIRTVVVDDEDDVRQLLKVRLERDGGFEVVAEGGSAGEAVALCAAQRPHVVILDAGMPGGNGLLAVPDIRRASPATIVVIYTSDSTLATRNEAEKAGAHAVVGKLDSLDLLVGTIHRFLPQFAPKPDAALQDRAEFGQRMTALLDDGVGADGEPWWRRRGTQSRRWMIVVLVLVVLPLLAAIAWVIAQLAGHGLGLG